MGYRGGIGDKVQDILVVAFSWLVILHLLQISNTSTKASPVAGPRPFLVLNRIF